MSVRRDGPPASNIDEETRITTPRGRMLGRIPEPGYRTFDGAPDTIVHSRHDSAIFNQNSPDAGRLSFKLQIKLVCSGSRILIAAAGVSPVESEAGIDHGNSSFERLAQVCGLQLSDSETTSLLTMELSVLANSR